MQHRQRGMTFVGLLILVCFIGMFVYAGLRLTPVYLEYFKVQKALGDLKRETEGSVSPRTIQIALGKRFDIEDITVLDPKSVEVTKSDTGWTVHAAYDVTVPFFGNVSFLVHFDKTVQLGAT